MIDKTTDSRNLGRFGKILHPFAHDDSCAQQKHASTLSSQTIIDNMVEGVVITNVRTEIISVNRAFSAVTGYRKQEVIGKTPSLLQSGRHDKKFYQEMWASIQHKGLWHGEIWNRRKNGELYPELLTITAIKDPHGQITNYLGVFTDITVKKISEDQLLHLAYHDSLTGLPNRLLCMDRLKQAVAHAKRKEYLVAVLYVDLDGFKEINDSLGHATGDRLLQKVANRLQNLVREEDTVTRLGGDEFVVILVDITNQDHAAKVASTIADACREPFEFAGHEFKLSASIGISLYPTDETNPKKLIALADKAMYAAKSQGKNQHQFFAAL